MRCANDNVSNKHWPLRCVSFCLYSHPCFSNRQLSSVNEKAAKIQDVMRRRRWRFFSLASVFQQQPQQQHQHQRQRLVRVNHHTLHASRLPTLAWTLCATIQTSRRRYVALTVQRNATIIVFYVNISLFHIHSVSEITNGSMYNVPCICYILLFNNVI